MTGTLFLINVPRKEYETCLIKNKSVQKKLSEITKDHQKVKSDNLKNESKGEVSLTVSEVQGKDGTDGMASLADKVKSKKLKITRPMRGINIADAFDRDTPLETVLSDVMKRLDVRNATWCPTQNNKFWQVTFSLEAGGNSKELLQVLRTLGIGARHQSSLSIVPCTFFYGTTEPRKNNGECENSATTGPWSRFSSSIQARTNLAQVLQSVRADAALTFDWCFLLLVAALIAAIGLFEDSAVVLVASMLISPLMGPITAATQGIAVRDRSLQMIGIIHELVGLLMCLSIGFLFGLAICAVDSQLNIVNDWPTAEMTYRCEYRSLWVGMLIAIPSGAGVALAVLGDYTASLVGVAISASLLPPAVNAGLLWAMSVYRMIYNNDLTWREGDPLELAVLGSRSLCLTVVNIVCIYVAGVAVYKVKNVGPLEQRDITWWTSNKNRLASKRLNTTAWEIYRWPSSQLEKTDPNVHETITFRRPHVLQTTKAQTLENCFRNVQMNESYQPQESGASESQNSETIKLNHRERKTELPEFCFLNLGYENRKFEESPTIEPTQNITVGRR